MLNQVVVMGRLTRDPELRSTQSGVSVTSFSIAVERDYKEKQEPERKTDFFDVVAWQASAEFAAKYFSKGVLAIVRGRLQNRKYEDKTGATRQVTEIVAESLYFAESNRSRDDSASAPSEKASPSPAKKQTKKKGGSPLSEPEPNMEASEEDDEELPF